MIQSYVDLICSFVYSTAYLRFFWLDAAMHGFARCLGLMHGFLERSLDSGRNFKNSENIATRIGEKGQIWINMIKRVEKQ